MRRSINQKVLITSWPPPPNIPEFVGWNPTRFSVWVQNTMKKHKMTNQHFIRYGMQEQTIISVKKGKYKPRKKTIHHFVMCILKHNPMGRTRNGLLKEATMNMTKSIIL